MMIDQISQDNISNQAFLIFFLVPKFKNYS